VTVLPTDSILPQFVDDITEYISRGISQERFQNRIKQYQVTNVTTPNFSFKKETIPDGILVKTFPVLDFSGFTFSILFQEDINGTIVDFIEWCKMRIVNEDGIYYHPDVSRIGDIMVEIINGFNEPVSRYVYKNAYFLEATPITFDYTNSTTLPISITFGADNVETSIRGRI
jgi:hypothetical protein